MAKVSYEIEKDRDRVYITAILDKSLVTHGASPMVQFSISYLNGENMSNCGRTMQTAIEKLLKDYHIRESDLKIRPQH